MEGAFDNVESSINTDEIAVFLNGEFQMPRETGIDYPDPEIWGYGYLDDIKKRFTKDNKENISGPDPAIWGSQG